MIKVYLVQQPRSLESLALQKLVTWVALQAENILPTSYQYYSDAEAVESTLCNHIDLIQNILESNVPQMLHDQLFNETKLALLELEKKVIPPHREMERGNDIIIDYYGIDGIYPPMVDVLRSIIWRMLESVFTKHVTFLDIKGWKSKGRIVNASFNKKLYKLTGVTHLESDYDNETSTINALKILNNLKCFTLQRNDYPNRILTPLVENCKFIEELNMAQSNINHESLDIISQLHDLKSINLTYTNATSEDIVKILMSCKNIEYIFVNTNVIAEALECIVSLRHNSGIQFKLKSYSINSCGTNLEQLKLIVQTCPEIEDMTIFKNIQGQNYFNVLYDLQNLQKLELTNYRFYTDKVCEFLNAKGQSLQYLNLHYIHEINLDALMHIGSTCPQLETLIIKKTYENTNINFNKTSMNMPLYTNLKQLDFHVDESNQWNDMKLLSFLLSNSPKIEYVTTLIGPSSENMLQIFVKNPLACLKKLEMWYSCLRREVLDMIVENSVNFPEIIDHCYNHIHLPIEDCGQASADYDYDDYYNNMYD